MRNLLLIKFTLLLSLFTVAQENQTATVRGKVKDSVYNFMVNSATVAVYKQSDSSLLQFTIPNNGGEFEIKNVSRGVPLFLLVTHIGYKDISKGFNIPKETGLFDFGLLQLYREDRNSGNLEEVVVKSIAPVRINGDTLEFNADAFKMHPNATTEDLMRRLPGIVIWSDGDITFNGKKIKQVLVEGKPFLGTNITSVATQNIPKEALDKVQVYQEPDTKNPFDSTMNINLKLKSNKQIGYFGKVSGGYGLQGSSSDKVNRYSLDGMLSAFNKRLSLTTVGSSNNINKIATSIDALLKNSSYKGEGINLDFQSDFNMQGLNKPLLGGVRMQYDLQPQIKNSERNRLGADYFLNSNKLTLISDDIEKNFLTEDTVLSTASQTRSYQSSQDHRGNFRYERVKESFEVMIEGSGGSKVSDDFSESQRSQEKTGVGILNHTSSRLEGRESSKQGLARVTYINKNPDRLRKVNSFKRVPSEFSLMYDFNVVDSKGHSKKDDDFYFTSEPHRNLSISRLYLNNDKSTVSHTLSFTYPNLRELIFGRAGVGGVDIKAVLNSNLRQISNNDLVEDFNEYSGSYVPNSNLSFDRDESIKLFTPQLQISKKIQRNVTNHFNKSLALEFNAVQNYYDYRSKSTVTDQNIQFYNQKFTPNASIKYGNHQFGSHETNYFLTYSSYLKYPTINQFAPLLDLSNPLYRPMGNRELKPEYTQDLGMEFEFITRTSKNPWTIDASVGVEQTKNYIVDSTIYDESGGRTTYMVNTNEYRELTGAVNLQKSLAIDERNVLEFDMKLRYSLSREPRFINNYLNLSNSQQRRGTIAFDYRRGNLLNMRLEQNFSFFGAVQTGVNEEEFKSFNQFTRFIATMQPVRAFTLSTNITYSRNEADKSDMVEFTIWNASLAYRFLKQENFEVKFSALDLLNQNRGIINSSYSNTQRFRNTNVLQQYFMLTFSFFPRKFGKNQ